MFLRVLIYRLKKTVHDRETMLWALLFPIVLGTFFNLALGSVYSHEMVDTKQVALVGGSEENTKFVKSTLESIQTGDGTPMFEVLLATTDDEKKLLFEDEIAGVMDISDMTNIQLRVANDDVSQNVLAHVIGIFRRNAVLTQEAMKNPQAAAQIMELMSQDVELVKQVNAAGENKDPYVSYMYALLAMVCIMAANAGLAVPVDAQVAFSSGLV